MENVNPSSTLGSLSQEPSVTTHAKFMARRYKLLEMRQTIDSLLFKTINESTNQSSDSEIFCPKERIKELKLRTQQRNNFEDELFKDRFPIEKELAYHKELLGEPQPPFLTLEPKIKREDLSSVIDSGLSEVVLGQPFAHTSRLTYDESLGLIRFSQRDDEVVFRIPQRKKELDLVSSLEKDKFELATISLDRLDFLKEDIIYQSLRKSLSLSLSFLDS
nr:protein kinase-like domain, concanavalin A-like lectin/glucanase domain protein [Tanacetum cinerariifolium]